MTTLGRYRKCFEACGIEFQEGTDIQWMDGYSAFLERAGGPELGEHESLCVCRCAAEDWLWSKVREGGEWCSKKNAGPSPLRHEYIIDLCYAVSESGKRRTPTDEVVGEQHDTTLDSPGDEQ